MTGAESSAGSIDAGIRAPAVLDLRGRHTSEFQRVLSEAMPLLPIPAAVTPCALPEKSAAVSAVG